jgi:hypothetical protein
MASGDGVLYSGDYGKGTRTRIVKMYNNSKGRMTLSPEFCRKYAHRYRLYDLK